MMHIPCLFQPQLAILAESHSLKFQKNLYHEGIVADSQVNLLNKRKIVAGVN